MYILNIGFVIETLKFDSTAAWLLGKSAEVGECAEIERYELLQVAEVPGDPDFGKETRNVSLQLTFGSLHILHEWIEKSFESLVSSYSAECGEPLIFMTILKPL